MDNKSKQLHRIGRHRKVRSLITGTKARPRVSVFRSNKHIFVQLIDDESRRTVMSSKIPSLSKSKLKGGKSEKAIEIGRVIGEKARAIGIREVVFDRGGYKYHGRVKALADGLRVGGLKF